MLKNILKTSEIIKECYSHQKIWYFSRIANTVFRFFLAVDFLTVVSDEIVCAFLSGATGTLAPDISKADRIWHAGLLHNFKSDGTFNFWPYIFIFQY